MVRYAIMVVCSLFIVSCGSSSKQRLGESFALHGLAKVEEKDQQGNNNNNGNNNGDQEQDFQCTFEMVNDIAPAGPSKLCIVVENLMTTQRILLRDYEVEFRIPGALVQPPAFRVPLSGLLDKKPRAQQGSQSQQTSLEFDYFLTQGNQNDSEGVYKSSIPIMFPPFEFFHWYIANLGAMPRQSGIPTEAIITAHGQTSPGGDWVKTNKSFIRVTLPGPR